MLTRAIRALLTLTLFAVPVAQADTTAAGLTAAPGYGELGYELPKIGSYQLPSLGRAHDGEVLDTQGRRQHLYELFDQKYVLLATAVP
ncbi:MAG: hypothetical protein KZQ78_16665 [Candidatus Thiodiazotropha sp. (ex Ustalcina ferruginea)]|nr:hypothetical protein [Candidatus Thiodiazotropha sp. (ex Ustalcina ferruginea)]